MTAFSFQLYSARNYPPLGDTLALLARLGYQQVEGFGGVYGDPAELKAELDANGLTMPTGHFSIDQLRDRDGAVELARTLGIETIVCPFIPQERWKQSEADWVAFAHELEDFAAYYKAQGFGFAWHNHHFEFWPLESGRTPMEIILAEAPSVDWEIDVAWVVRGDEDPQRWIDEHADRIVAVHLKDIAAQGQAENEDGWADLGHGTIDWPALFDQVKTETQAKYFVMEHDNPNDIERFALRSLETAKAL